MDYAYSKLWTVLFLLHLANGSPRECCRHIPNKAKYTPCKDACEQAWMSSGPLQQIEVFSTAYRHCPIKTLVSFWRCIGTNYPVLTDIELWEGRACCELAYSSECQLGCQNAIRSSDLQNNCVEADESALYSCVRRQTGYLDCCHSIDSLQCKAACRAMFISSTSPSHTLQENLAAVCTAENSHVHQCVGNNTEQHVEATLPAKSLECCEQSSTSVCKQTCAQAFTGLTSQKDIIETLIPVCGQPVSTDPLWQCFLLSQSPPKNGRLHVNEQLSPMDGASLQCCSRAFSPQCQSLCIQWYNRRLSSVWESFSATCQYNSKEALLMECIQDVQEPCQVGCERLEFCSNFNGRTYSMFRSCNRKADLAASTEYNSWLRNQYIQLPSYSVPIKDIQYCEPDMWKAISCALNVKPCNIKDNSNRICKSDCMHILSRCVDDSKMSYDIDGLCDQLLVSDEKEECVSLRQFTEPSSKQPSVDLTNPCIPNPCNSSEICEVNRNYPTCRTTHKSCHAFVCRSGCPAGMNSPLLMKTNYHVKMLDVESLSPLNCQKICKCGHNGFLTHCQDAYCERADSCITKVQSIVEHGATFSHQCNRCVCHSGETICDIRYCPSESLLATSYGLPCDCQASYEPVCTTNGQVFSSSCLAQCVGYRENDYTMGNCASRNPCGENRCAHGSKCIPERKVCLSSSSPCPQHRCVPAHCDTTKHGVVCDDLGLQHSNVCILLARKRQLSYTGQCLSGCLHNSPVCAVNGETYMSECAALADSVLVDYHSPCHSAPHRKGDNDVCSHVICDKAVPEWCEGFIPLGACCPVCGSEIRSLYSMLHVDKIVSNSDLPYITTKDIAEHIRHHLTNRQCNTFVYISFEKELVVLILPTNEYPTQDEVKFCRVDAHRISNMINSKSPILGTDIKLSVLLTSSMHSSKIITIQMSSGKRYTPTWEVILTLYLIVSLAVT